jgi:alkylation response protein AidB-like acyl-CoA dehydrogenase
MPFSSGASDPGGEHGQPGVDMLAETEDQAALRQLARQLAEREVAPRAREADESGELSRDAVKALAEADLFGVTIGSAWGGLGLGDVEAAIVLEEIARYDVSTAVRCQLAFNGPGRGVEHLGSDALKDRWLPAIAAGDAVISIGITEPDAGSAVQTMRSALQADGPGQWRLDGYKNYSTLAHEAAGILVWCRWPGGSGADGIGAVVVPMDRDGVALTGRHRSMGIHAATESEVALDGVVVTEEDVLIAGLPGSTEPFKALLAHLNHERCGNAAMCVGAAQGALEHAVAYARERVVAGRPIAELQGVQWKLADMAVAVEGARLLLGRAVRLAGPGGTPPALETAMAKAAANLAAKMVCDEAMQIHGGYGYSHEYPVERAYRDIRGLCFGAGTVEAQRNFIGTNVARGKTTRSPGWRPLPGV